MIINLILASLIFISYMLWEIGNFNKIINRILKFFVDLSPLMILLFNRSISCCIFLILCLIANFVIFKNQIFGGIIFIIAYSFASIYSVWENKFNIIALLISLITIIIIEFILLKFYKDNKIGIIIYGLSSSLLCVYAFIITKNVGFLCLMLGDTLLIVNEIHKNKTIFLISDLFYFLGTCLVPLSLI